LILFCQYRRTTIYFKKEIDEAQCAQHSLWPKYVIFIASKYNYQYQMKV